MLVNAPKYRIQKYPRGFVVEVKVTYLFFFTKWVHIISYSGLRDCPFYYSTFENAYNEFVIQQRYDILSNSDTC